MYKNFIFKILFFMGFASIFFLGCSEQPKIVYKYIEKPCPKLQILSLDELNLTKEKPLKIKFKIQKNKIKEQR